MTSPPFKLLFRVLAALASAVAVISGYLLFMSLNAKNRDDDFPETGEMVDDTGKNEEEELTD